MITSIRLVNFKNFADETLRVGPFTVIVGANASGKSNIRDAFRFLHGIGRGYSLAEIIGGKYGADWKPIRGAANEIVRFGQAAFSIEVRMELEDAEACYLIEVSSDKERPNEFRFTKEEITGVFKLDIFANMRFLELSPDRMREPALPGATVLGDSGENLPVVLEDICSDPKRKEILADWLSELTPMDVADFKFPRDPSGRVHLMLCETNGRKVSAYSASDGTLRFLAMLAVLLGDKSPAGLYFFEEINRPGIHPARQWLVARTDRKAGR